MTNPEWKDLEKDIIKLVKEHYHLSNFVVYQTLDPDIEALIIGGDDNETRRDRSMGAQ